MIGKILRSWKKNQIIKRRMVDDRFENLGRFGGHEIFAFKEFPQMSKYREIAVRKSFHEMELGIKVDDLQKYIILIDEFINAGDFSSVAGVNKVFKGYMDQYMSERVSIELGGWAILVDDEPEDEPRSEDSAIKRKLVSDYMDCRIFFLNTALSLLTDLSDQFNASSAREYMKVADRAVREQMFLNSISTSLSDNLWNGFMTK